MNKIFLIIQREYLSRVKKKSFLVITFLVPVIFMGMMSLIVYLAMNQGGLGDKKKVEVADESGWFKNRLPNSTSIEYTYVNDFAAAERSFLKSDYDYLLHVPANMDSIELEGVKTPGIMSSSTIEDDLSAVAKRHRLADAHIDSTALEQAQKPIHVKGKNLGKDGKKDTNTGAASGIGLAGAFLIYLSLFLYGSQVMRGVIEEKVSRIIEVIISSVKPFQLMMGKIIGVGMVGLTQFVMWIVLTFTLSTVTSGLMMGGKGAAMQGNAKVPNGHVGEMLQQVGSLPIITIVCCFLFYFLFGYLLYSALFAAVGSAVDNETETQQFILPITAPLILTFAISQSIILTNPDSTLSVWLSMIPFTAPIAMMMRIPFGVPLPQLIGSMAFMVIGFLFTTWVAGRIYRVGILMYGKKASYKELVKWFMYKE